MVHRRQAFDANQLHTATTLYQHPVLILTVAAARGYLFKVPRERKHSTGPPHRYASLEFSKQTLYYRIQTTAKEIYRTLQLRIYEGSVKSSEPE